MNRKKEIIFIITLLIFGFFYRLFFSSLAASDIIWDMKNYHILAMDLLSGKLASDCCSKNPGYSLFLAGVYYLFGPDNLTALRVTQSVLDLMVALLVYLTAQRLFSKRAAIFSFILYLVNPLTVSYTGLRLPETITIFYITSAAYISSLPAFGKKKLLWIAFGMMMGLVLLTRMQYYYFVFALIGVMGVFCFSKVNRVFFIICSLAGFFIISSYSLAANYINYKKVSLVPPSNPSYGGLYINFYNDFRYPELTNNIGNVNPDYANVMSKFGNLNFVDKLTYNQELKKLFIEKIQKDWPLFMTNVMRNIIWMWDKEHLFAYEDPFYPGDSIPLRIFNIVLLLLFFFGIVAFIMKKRLSSLRVPVLWITIVLFLYITCMISLISNETRHSMACYSLLILWAGYGIASITKL